MEYLYNKYEVRERVGGVIKVKKRGLNGFFETSLEIVLGTETETDQDRQPEENNLRFEWPLNKNRNISEQDDDFNVRESEVLEFPDFRKIVRPDSLLEPPLVKSSAQSNGDDLDVDFSDWVDFSDAPDVSDVYAPVPAPDIWTNQAAVDSYMDNSFMDNPHIDVPYVGYPHMEELNDYSAAETSAFIRGYHRAIETFDVYIPEIDRCEIQEVSRTEGQEWPAVDQPFTIGNQDRIDIVNETQLTQDFQLIDPSGASLEIPAAPKKCPWTRVQQPQATYQNSSLFKTPSPKLRPLSRFESPSPIQSDLSPSPTPMVPRLAIFCPPLTPENYLINQRKEVTLGLRRMDGLVACPPWTPGRPGASEGTNGPSTVPTKEELSLPTLREKTPVLDEVESGASTYGLRTRLFSGEIASSSPSHRSTPLAPFEDVIQVKQPKETSYQSFPLENFEFVAPAMLLKEPVMNRTSDSEGQVTSTAATVSRIKVASAKDKASAAINKLCTPRPKKLRWPASLPRRRGLRSQTTASALQAKASTSQAKTFATPSTPPPANQTTKEYMAVCPICKQEVYLENLNSHVQSDCQSFVIEQQKRKRGASARNSDAPAEGVKRPRLVIKLKTLGPKKN